MVQDGIFIFFHPNKLCQNYVKNKLHLIVLRYCQVSVFLRVVPVVDDVEVPVVPAPRVVGQPGVDPHGHVVRVCHRGRGTRGLPRVVISSSPSQATREDPLESSSELCRHETVEHRVYGTESKSYCYVVLCLDERTC